VINVLAVTMGQSTGYADVDAVLARLLAGVRGTLGRQLVGVYLDGSLATGDFAEQSSDIDVLVVTEDALSDEVVAALGTMHARLATGPSSGRESSRFRTSRAVRFAASIPTTIVISASSVAATSSSPRNMTATG
jgi:predicted nucleotidyltransferase